MHAPEKLEDTILIDAQGEQAREIWLRCRDLGKTVCLYNCKNSSLWEEIRATHRHREMGDNMAMVPLNAVRLPDQPDWINDIIEKVQPFTLTRPERIASLCTAIEYISINDIPGAIVECGVWRGGSMMAAALALQNFDDERDIWLYDTFSGMTKPTDVDKTAHTGEAASDIMAKMENGWCLSPLDEVKENLESVGAGANLIVGDVLETIPGTMPPEIALLRLDTDWYESTKHELTHLYPRLSSGGVLIVDDYGHWLGARKAVDEWTFEANPGILLTRIDYSCRMAVKPMGPTGLDRYE